MKKKYRIVTDVYAGYEVQYRYSLMPFWLQVNGTNTHVSPQDAEEWLREYLRKNKSRQFVKYVEDV